MKYDFKKLLFIIAFFSVMVISLSSCGGKDEVTPSAPIQSSEPSLSAKEKESPAAVPSETEKADQVKPSAEKKEEKEVLDTTPSDVKTLPEEGSSPPVTSVVPLEKGKAESPSIDGALEEEVPAPMDPDSIEVTDKELTCYLSITCDAILNNLDKLASEKSELIPKDGVILPLTEVTFYEGESAFNVFQRETKKNKIHMEFVNTPLYDSAYIEGINNIYEFDCGELSGWMYKVNELFPSYGSSRYLLSDGDIIEWVYTCDLGRDVGNDGYSKTDDQP